MDTAQGCRTGVMLLLIFPLTVVLTSAGEPWHLDHSNSIDTGGAPPKSKVEVVCSRDHMTVHLHFSQPFQGLVFSHTEKRQDRCVHLGPRAGVTSASFQINYNGCGTTEDLSGRFHENTIVIQFGEDILEAWDEAKRLRCEWLESFEKPSSKPTLAISDIDVVELNFQGDDIDCWMEIQEGKGPWSRKVAGLVPIGSPLTLVIAINDPSREFDMRIKRCTATDGAGGPGGAEIELTDAEGCVTRRALLTPFAKVRDLSSRATLVAYSHIHAFKFPDRMDVFVHCIVEVCRHGCPDACGPASGQLRRPAGALESKKVQLLAEFAKKPSHGFGSPSNHRIGDVFVEGTSGGGGSHHGHGAHPFQGIGEAAGGALLEAAQSQIRPSKNVTLLSTVETQGKKILVNRATFKPKSVLQANQKAKDSATAASNVHEVVADVGNHLHQPTKDGGNEAHANYHRIIGHDVHWVDENHKPNHDAEEPVAPSLGGGVSYQPPWSVDQVRPLTKQEAFLNLQKSKTGQAFFSAEEVTKLAKVAEDSIPRPEPSAWSADEVSPLSKQQDIPLGLIKHLTGSQDIVIPEDFLLQAKKEHELPQFLSEGIKTTHVPWNTQQGLSNLHIQGPDIPSPEPSSWKIEEVKAVHIPSRKQQEMSHLYVHKPEIPQPEPAPWKFEDVNPMHIPEVLVQHTRRPEVPQPEPGPWSLDNAKPLTKEDLRLLSLNYKLKNVHGPIPTYQEYALPFTTTTAVPQPVYVPNLSMNMSMKNMMMMMSTMLPQTYQTALWPQRPTTRFLRPQRHHYPYPVPQFSPHQQQMMMLGVVADRRSDDDSEEGGDLTSSHNLAGSRERVGVGVLRTAGTESTGSIEWPVDFTESEDTELVNHTMASGEEKIRVGETYKEEEDVSAASSSASSSRSAAEALSDDFTVEEISSTENIPITVSSTDADPKPTTDSKLQTDAPATRTSASEPSSSLQSSQLEPSSPNRRPVSGFVPPSLDLSGSDPETSDRAAHGPRALDRRKRSSEPVFGVRQSFRAIAPADLAFEWNLTAEQATVLRGRREDIVYGVCVSPASMSAGVGFVLILTLLAVIASVVLYEHACLLTKKTSQLAFITRGFNGRFEALYRFTRPYLYPANGNHVR